MTVDLTFFLVAGGAVLFAGVMKGGFANAMVFAATPTIAMILPLNVTLGVLLPLLLLMDITSLRLVWRRWDPIALRSILMGIVPGVLLGLLIFRSLSFEALNLILGVIVISFVGFQVLRSFNLLPPPRRKMGRVAGAVCGAASATMSFVAHAGGPPLIIYLLSQKLDKATFHATTVVVFFCINLVKLSLYIGEGIITLEAFNLSLMLVPFAIAGVYLGARVQHLVSDRIFFPLIYVGVLILGVRLIVQSLPALI